MFRQTLTIARNTLVESLRQPVYFIILLLCAIALLLTTWSTGFSLGFTTSGEVTKDDKLLFDIGLATVLVCGVLLSAFIATAVLSREIDRKTVLTVVSKPVPRPAVVLGKFLGVCGAQLLAVATMLFFLQLSIRHGVMSTAADKVDVPVVVFSLMAFAVAIGIGAWGNYFYGWSFPQTASVTLGGAMLLAWLGVLFVSKSWSLQPLFSFVPVPGRGEPELTPNQINTALKIFDDGSLLAPGPDLKPQLLLACLAVLAAQPVICAIAIAASAKLGQVMTIVVCSGVFVFSLLSNYLVGRHAVRNEFVGIVASAEPNSEQERAFTSAGDTWNLKLEFDARFPIRPGSPLFYGPTPNGAGIANPNIQPFTGDFTHIDGLVGPNVPHSIVVTDATSREVRIVLTGSGRMNLGRPPQEGDFIFLTPTNLNPAAAVIWGVVPNLQFFWLVDAVTQNVKIPLRHVWLVMMYGLLQVGVFLSLAVILFQSREVG